MTRRGSTLRRIVTRCALAAALASGCSSWTPTTGSSKTSEYVTQVRSLAFSPDGRTLAVGTGNRGLVRLVDVATGELRGELRPPPRGEDPVLALAWSPDGQTLAAGGGDANLRLWDTRTRALRAALPGHSIAVGATAFRPDGRELASADTDGTVHLWDMPSGAARSAFKPRKSMIETLAWSARGDLLVLGYRGEVVFWDVARGAEQRSVGKIGFGYAAPAWRAEDGAIAIAEDGVKIRIEGGSGLSKVPGARSSTALALRPGAAIEVASIDGSSTVQLCDLQGCYAELPPDPRHAISLHVLAWSPDGRTLATAGRGPVARIVDAATRTVQPVFIDGLVDRPRARPR